MSSDDENPHSGSGSNPQPSQTTSNIFGIPSVVLDSSSNPFSLSTKTLEGPLSKSPKKKTGKKSARLNEVKAKKKHYPFFAQEKGEPIPSFVPDSEDLQAVSQNNTPPSNASLPVISILGVQTTKSYIVKSDSPTIETNATLNFEEFMKEYNKSPTTPEVTNPKMESKVEKESRPKRTFVRVRGGGKHAIPSLVEMCVSNFMQSIDKHAGKINQLDQDVKMRLLEFCRKYGWLSSSNISYFFDENTTRIEVDASAPFIKEIEIITKCSPHITHASFANSFLMDDDTLKKFLEVCGPNLVNLDISKCEVLTNSFTKIADCTKLQVLNLSGTFLAPKSSLKPILKNCTSLQQLSMRQCGLSAGVSDILQQYGGRLLFLDISEPKHEFKYEKAGFMRGTTSLIELRADGLKFQHEFIEEAFFLNFEHCTSLRTLSLKNVVMKDLKLDPFFLHAFRLERLNIAGSQIAPKDCIQLAKQLTNLQVLDISNCDKLGNETLEALSENTKIQELRIIGNTLITEEQISKFKSLTNAIVLTNNY